MCRGRCFRAAAPPGPPAGLDGAEGQRAAEEEKRREGGPLAEQHESAEDPRTLRNFPPGDRWAMGGGSCPARRRAASEGPSGAAVGGESRCFPSGTLTVAPREGGLPAPGRIKLCCSC